MKQDAKNEIVARLKITATSAAKKRKVKAAPMHPMLSMYNKVVNTFESKLGEPTERGNTASFGRNTITYTSSTWDIRSNKGEKPIFDITLDHKDSHIIFTYASDVVKATAGGPTLKDAAKAFTDGAFAALDYSESHKRDTKADNENLRSILGILSKIN